jgi:PAS domain S-box-containing protein
MKAVFGKSLRFRLVAAAVVVEVLMLALLIANSVRLIDDRMWDQAELRMRDVSRALNVSLAGPLVQRNYAALQEILDGMRADEGMEYLVLYGQDNRVVAASGWDDGRSLPPVGGKTARYGDRLDSRLAIRVAGQELGTLRYGISLSALKDARADLIRDSVLIGAAEVILSVILLAALSYWLTRHLARLTKASQAVAAGDFSVSLDAGQQDEVGQLTWAFNHMAVALQKRIEALRRSEANLAEAQRVGRMGSWEWDIATDGVQWSDETYRIFGWDPAGRAPPFEACRQAVHPDDRTRMDAAIREALAQCKTYECEYRIVLPDGSEKHVHGEGTLIFDEAGEAVRMFGIIQDITERRRAEIALKESEQRQKAILSNIPDLVWLKDAEGRYLAVNEAFERSCGKKLEEVVGRTDADLWSAEWAEKYRNQDLEVMRSGRPIRVEEHYRNPDGSRWLDAVKAPVLDWQSRVVGTAGTARDVTARKRDEASLAHLNRSYAMLSLTNEAIVRMRDRDRLLRRVCEIAVENGKLRMAWVGLTDERNAVRPVAHWGHEEGYLRTLRISLEDAVRGAGPTGTALKRGQHLVCRDIATDPMMAPWREEALKRGYRSMSAYPLQQSGRVVGAINLYAAERDFFTDDIVKLLDDLAADISFALDFIGEAERRAQAEREVSKLNAELEERVAVRTSQLEAANRELEAFSYSVSHDLRAPLRSIGGFSQILVKKYADRLDATGKDYLERVSRASQRMGELIDDLLKLSRVARGELRREEVDLSAIARSVADDLQDEERGRKVQFRLAEGVRAQGDAKLLRIVLENLLGNAWKFTRKVPEAIIEFGMTEQDGAKTVFVRDNGAGFNMDYAHKLFGAFQRLHGANEFEGTGIGLATVQRIIHRHGGRVWGEGAPGEGATFYFTCNQGKGREAA